MSFADELRAMSSHCWEEHPVVVAVLNEVKQACAVQAKRGFYQASWKTYFVLLSNGNEQCTYGYNVQDEEILNKVVDAVIQHLRTDKVAVSIERWSTPNSVHVVQFYCDWSE